MSYDCEEAAWDKIRASEYSHHIGVQGLSKILNETLKVIISF